MSGTCACGEQLYFISHFKRCDYCENCLKNVVKEFLINPTGASPVFKNPQIFCEKGKCRYRMRFGSDKGRFCEQPCLDKFACCGRCISTILTRKKQDDSFREGQREFEYSRKVMQQELEQES